jgi:hypothetical protein
MAELQARLAECGLEILHDIVPIDENPPRGHRDQTATAVSAGAKPLVSCRVIVDLISATTTKTGLTVRWQPDPVLYPKGIVVSDAEMMAIYLVRNELHTEWNYMIQPTDRAVYSWRGPNPTNGGSATCFL